MKTGDNPQHRRMTIREVSNDIGCSYEHVRKVLAGEPVMSRDITDSISRLLGLDADQMWALAESEKSHRRFPNAANAFGKVDARLMESWVELDDTDRECVVRVTKALAVRAAIAKQFRSENRAGDGVSRAHEDSPRR
jgi:hypothetical protein